MWSLNEALARERAQELVARAQRATVARELTAARRWHRVQRHALDAQRRHTRAARVAHSAVAERAHG